MKPKQFYWLLLAVLAGLLVAGAAGYYLATRQIEADTKTLQSRLADVETTDATIGQLNQLGRQYQKIAPLLPRLDEALPRAKQQSAIVLQIQQLGTAAGLNLPSAAFSATTGVPSPTTQTTAQGDVLVMPLNFQLSGSYEQLQNFLQGLEKLNRYVSVTNLGIVRADKPKLLSVNVGLNVYLKP